MLNGGARLDQLPLDVLYEIGYAEMYRQVEIMVQAPVFDEKAREHPLQTGWARIDQSIEDATPDTDTGLPNWVLRTMPVAADGTAYAVPDVSLPDEEPMPPPGARPGKPME